MRALRAGDSSSGVSTAKPAMRFAAASTSAMVGTRRARSELAKEVMHHLTNRRFVHCRRVPDAGQRVVDQIGLLRLHAEKGFGGEDIRYSAADDKGGRPADRAPQTPEVCAFASH